LRSYIILDLVNAMLQLNRTETKRFVKKVDFRKMNGLVPVVLQDASTDEVLMQAFMDREALRLTLSTGKMHFWSRTRRKIWLKGSKSGHFSFMQNAILDCDSDAILFRVQQIGACCHTGKETCFHKPARPKQKQRADGRVLERIFEVITERIRNLKEESYVSRLSREGDDAVLQKIGEEACELIISAKNGKEREIIAEATDLAFHLLILLASQGIQLEKIFEELNSRHEAKTSSKQVYNTKEDCT